MSKHAGLRSILLMAVAASVAACSTSKPTAVVDLNLGLNLAASLEGAYAASTSADPAVVVHLARLMTVAQAAVASWSASSSPSDQALAQAAIAALVAYEVSVRATP